MREKSCNYFYFSMHSLGKKINVYNIIEFSFILRCYFKFMMSAENLIVSIINSSLVSLQALNDVKILYTGAILAR